MMISKRFWKIRYWLLFDIILQYYEVSYLFANLDLEDFFI